MKYLSRFIDLSGKLIFLCLCFFYFPGCSYFPTPGEVANFRAENAFHVVYEKIFFPG